MEVSSKIFAEAGADALFIEQDFIRRYLTGFYSTDGYAVVTREGCTFVVDSRYFEAAEKALKNTNIKLVEGLYKQAEVLLSGAKTVGVPYPFTNLSRAETLKKNGFMLTDCMPALQAAMEIKTSKEIALIEKACEIAEDAYLALLPEIKEGMTESEVAALLEYKMRKFGASGVSFETIVAFGANGSVPHHETGSTKLKFGDAVLIDFGCKYEGYCSDCTRTFLFGDDKKHEDFKKVYAQVLHAHELVRVKHLSVDLFEIFMFFIVAEEEGSGTVRTIPLVFATEVNEHRVAEFELRAPRFVVRYTAVRPERNDCFKRYAACAEFAHFVFEKRGNLALRHSLFDFGKKRKVRVLCNFARLFNERNFFGSFYFHCRLQCGHTVGKHEAVLFERFRAGKICKRIGNSHGFRTAKKHFRLFI